MRNKDIINILKRLELLKREDQANVAMIIEDLQETMRWNKYVLIGRVIFVAGLSVGLILEYFALLFKHI
jgi:hypothetical protein